MFSAPFSRMLWKEYRSLRMLWAGCALGTLGLWLFIYVVTMLGTDSGQAPPELMHAFWSLALWLPAIYLLGCTVATFAGEKEERTAEWLINTARPLGSLFTAKVLWPVASAAVMQLVLFGAAGLVRQYFLATSNSRPIPADETLPELPALATFALVEALVWGLFWSLQLSKPMPAAVLAAICIVCLNIATINFRAFSAGWEFWWAEWGVGRTAIVVVLFLVDVWLARRWIAGRGVEWSIPWHRFVIHRTVSNTLPGVEQAVPWRRAWQRFRWLERQSTRIFLIVVVLWSLLSSLPMFFWPRHTGPGPTFFTLFFLPLFAGLVAWQGEQSRFQFRFLSGRGVSPYGLWWNKFVQWLTTLIAATFLVVIINWLGYELGQAVIVRDGNVANRINLFAGRIQPVGAMTCVGGYFLLFISAFTVGMYFRRTIFAFGAGFVMQMALFYWCLGSYYLDLPIWFNLLPLMAWLLWCGLRHLPRWYLERSGWSWNAVIAAEWLVFPILFGAAVTSYWVYSVPLPNVAQLLAMTPRPISGPGGAAYDRDWIDVLDRAANVVASRDLLPEGADSATWSVPAEPWSKLEPEVRGLRDALLKPNGMGPSTNFAGGATRRGLTSSMSVSKIILSLMQLADEDTAAGKSDEAIFDVRAAVRYAGALHADDRFNRTGIYSSAQDNSLYQRLQTWVRRSDMTSELVQRTLADLDKYELRWWLTDPMTLEAAYQDDLKDLDRIGATMGVRRWLVAPWLARQRRLNACKLSNRLRFLRTPPTGSQFGGITPGADSDAVWNFQSPLQPVYYTTDAAGLPVGLAPEVIAALRDRETRIRCTFAMMAAEAYRKQHGQLPSDLHQVTPQIASRELLTDPWSGAPLQIRTQGVPGEILETSNSQRITEIQPGTPFVWSVGPFGYQLQPAAYPAALHSGTFRFIPTRHAMVYVSRMPLYIYPLSPDPKSADENGQPADALHPAGAQAEESLGGVLYALPRDVDDDR